MNADCSDVKYLGRADKVYVYNGHTRELSFNFRVYASSKIEMAPMWGRINYLSGLLEPSSHKTEIGYKINTPPFIKLTIGDIYSKQPMILRSVSITIPDESPWEIDEGMQYPMMQKFL